MHNESVSASFRALVESRLKKGISHGSATVQSGGNDAMAANEPEVRTEVNLRVIRDFLKI